MYLKNIFSKFISGKISKNVLALLVLNIIIAIAQFTVFAIINRQLGKEIFGVWSLVTAASSIGQISNFGFSNCLVRYVPELSIHKKENEIRSLFSTVILLNFIVSLPLLFVLYFPAIVYAKQLLTSFQFSIFNEVVIVSLTSLFIFNLFNAYASLLDGIQKYYLRCYIQIFGWIVFVALSIMLMPHYGLKGVALSYFFQNLLQLMLGIAVVSKSKLFSLRSKITFDKNSFSKVFSFGIKSQTISVLVIFFDPLAKFFITKYSGLSSTANYELANKIVLQARNLLVNANQVIITNTVVHKSRNNLEQYFNSVLKRNTFFSVAVGLLFLATSPFIVYLFSGHLDVPVMYNIIIINIGWVFNMISSLHYFACIGLDRLDKLIFYHLLLFLVVGSVNLLFNLFSLPSASSYVPAIALAVGSIYNCFILAPYMKNSFQWIKDRYFQFFIFASIFLLVLYRTDISSVLFLSGLFVVVIFTFVFWGSIKKNILMKSKEV